MKTPLHVLIIEDSENDALLVLDELRRGGYEPAFERVQTAPALEAALQRQGWEVIISDYRMPHFSAPVALQMVRARGLNLPFIIVSGTIGEEVAVEMLKAGADDYLLKDRLTRLVPAVERALEIHRLSAERKQAEEAQVREALRYKTLMELSDDSIHLLDEQGDLLEANASFYRGMGYTVEEMRGKNVADWDARWTREELRERARELVDHSATFETRHRRKDGTVFDVEASVTSIRLDGKAVLFCITRDITERKRAAEQLHLAAQRLGLATESALIGVWDLDMEKNALIWDKRMYELYGIRPEDFGGAYEAWEKGVHPEDLPAVRAELQDAIAGKKDFHMQFRVVWPGGKVRHIEAHAVAQRGPDGTPQHVIGVNWDITERERAALRLEAFASLGQRLNSAKKAIEAGEIIMEVADQLFGWDACTLDLYSSEKDRMSPVFNRDTINGQRVSVPPIYDGVPPSPRARQVIERGAQLILREGPDTPSDGVPFGDTARRSASVMVVPIRDGSKVIGVLSIQSYKFKAYRPQDLEALQSLAEHCGGALSRIQTTEGLHESERLLRQVMDLVPHFIFAKDGDGHYLLANRACAEANGLTPEQMIGRCDLDLSSDRAQAERLMQDDRRVIAGTKSNLLLEEPLIDAAGRTRILQTVKIRFAAPGTGKPAVLGVSVDITEKKQIEAQMFHAQRLESIGTLASGVAHDLNNILFPIQMAAQLLEMGSLEEKERKMVATIIASTKRGAEIVKQVLAFSRSAPGKHARLQVESVVQESISIINETFPKNIQLQTSISANLPAIFGDATQIHQVLLNLCVNARDAMPHGGTLTLQAETFDVGESIAAMNPGTTPGRYVLLTVKDTGMGIPDAIMNRIFDPFFTTKEQGKGTGLGLSTVLGICRSHGGFVSAQSKPGHGTTFQVFLPVAAGQKIMADEAFTAKGPDGHGELVLVVDDEASILDMTRQLLTRSGYQVALASDGVQALAVFAAALPDVKLVVTDMMMPNMDGPALIRELRKINPLVPVIMSSGLGSSSSSADAASPDELSHPEALGVAFLAKPYRAGDLLITIRRLLDAAENGPES